ncbi:hypothetical protein HN51_023515 [Arachis hypogaea]
MFKVDPQYQIILRKNCLNTKKFSALKFQAQPKEVYLIILILLSFQNAMKNSSLQIAVHEQEKANKNLLRLAANQEHMEDDGDSKVLNVMDILYNELRDKEQSLREIGTLNQALIVKERKSNDELQDARKVLISGVKDVYSWQYWCEENGGT